MAQIERYCVRCRTLIPENRVSRGSCFCTSECRHQDKIERRRAKAEKCCRPCGRKLLKGRTPLTPIRAVSVESDSRAPGAQRVPLHLLATTNDESSEKGEQT